MLTPLSLPPYTAAATASPGRTSRTLGNASGLTHTHPRQWTRLAGAPHAQDHAYIHTLWCRPDTGTGTGTDTGTGTGTGTDTDTDTGTDTDTD